MRVSSFAMGTCSETVVPTVVDLCRASVRLPLSFLPGDHGVPSSLQSDGSPAELSYHLLVSSVDTKTCSHTHCGYSEYLLSYALPPSLSLSCTHT